MCLKFNIPESRQQDLKVYDQSDTEVDIDVFEEIVKQSPGTFKVTLRNEEPAQFTGVFIFNLKVVVVALEFS